MNKNYIAACILLVSSNSFASDVSIGVGLGIPYGVIGANINYPVNKTFDVTAGAGFGFGAGFRYHPFDDNEKFRLTAFYGTNAAIQESNSDSFEKFSGLNFGVGYGSLSDGWDIDLIFAFVSSATKNRVDELEAQGNRVDGESSNSIDISFGYHW